MRGELVWGAFFLMLAACFACMCVRGREQSPPSPSTALEDGSPRHEGAAVGDARRELDDARSSIGDPTEVSVASVSSDGVSIPASTLDTLYLDELRLIDPIYLPSLESLDYHVEHHFGQIRDLKLEYVRRLFPEGCAYDLSGEGTLLGRFEFPTAADIDRLWHTPGFRAKFTEYLDLEHRAFVTHELRWALDEPALEGVSDATGKRAGAAWDELWVTPDPYPHWAFLMEVARRHFQ